MRRVARDSGMPAMCMSNLSKRAFWICVVGFACLYLALQWLYSRRLPLNVDEFHGAAEVYRLFTEMPYRDYRPYKTVLGYYLQVPGLMGSEGWEGLIALRRYMAVLSAAALIVLVAVLEKLFRREAIVIGAGLLVIMSTFLERSAEIRVDMLTGWAGVFTLVALLLGYPFAGGFIAGVAFLVSQKGAFYVVAGLLALLTAQMWHGRLQAFKQGARFLGGGGIALALYLVVWVLLAGPSAVFEPTFGGAADVARRNVYSGLRASWVVSIFHNPLFYVLAALGVASALISGFLERDEAGDLGARNDRLLTVFVVVLLFQALGYAQAWPYFLLIVVPVLAVAVIRFLNGRLGRRSPLGLSTPLAVLIGLFGLIVPVFSILVALNGTTEDQEAVFRAARSAVDPDEAYWAGSNFLYDRSQVGVLGWLDRYNLSAFRASSPEARQAALEVLASNPPAVVVNNYRLDSLPHEFQQFLGNNYLRVWGPLLTYAPQAGNEDTTVWVGLPGRYLIEETGYVLAEDGRAQQGDTIDLGRGEYRIGGGAPRLRRVEPALDTLRAAPPSADIFTLRR